MPDKNKGQLTTAEVMFWASEAQSCIERQKVELVQRNNYPFLVNYYEGIEKLDPQHPHVTAEHKMAIINEYFPSTNSLISELIYKRPDILLDANKPQAEEDTPLMRSALTHFFDKSDSLTENRVGLFDMLYAGYSAVEVDIMPKSVKQAKPEPDAEPKQESVFDKAVSKVKSAMNMEEAEKNLARVSPPMEANYSTVQGTYVRRYDPLDVPLDWRARRLKDRRYNVKKVWLSKAEFDVKYPKFRNQVSTEEDPFMYGMHRSQVHNRKVLLYEFQVRMEEEEYHTIIISTQVKTRELDTWIRPYTTNGFNMKIGTLHKYGKLYPKSFAQINKKMQDEMNHYVRHLMEVAERNIPKRIYDKNKITETEGVEQLTNTQVNANVPCNGNTSGAVVSIQPTVASYENKELLSIFQDQKNKLWSVSEARISGRSQAEFATDLAIQEEGFETRNADIQEGLRASMREQLNTGKDLIARYWDDEVFLKVTGHPKMDWYEPNMIPDPKNPERQIVENPLSDVLTGDYNVDIDIESSARENKSQKLQKMSFFMKLLVEIRQLLIDQGKDINIEEIQRISKEFGWNPDKLLVDFKPQGKLSVPTAGGETISPEEDARREAEAGARSQEGAEGEVIA